MVGELRGCDLAALAYKIKIYETLFCGSFGKIYENLHQRKFPTIRLINYNTTPCSCTQGKYYGNKIAVVHGCGPQNFSQRGIHTSGGGGGEGGGEQLRIPPPKFLYPT